MKNTCKVLTVVAGLAPLLLATSPAAPVAITGIGSCTQDFDTLPVSGTDNPWADDTTLASWYAQKATGDLTAIAASTGSSTGGALYSFGVTDVTERALGSLGSNSSGHFAYGVLFQNTGTEAVYINSISYTGEQWRNGGNTTQHKLTFSYQKSTTAITALTPDTQDGWTAVAALDFTGPIATTPAGALDGNLPENQMAISGDPAIAVAPGEYVMLRWHDPNDSGSDHGLAIDNLAISWTVTTDPALVVNVTVPTFSESAGLAASMGTVSIPAALGTDLVVDLLSSDTTEATVPATVTISAGFISADFQIDAMDDFLADGAQPVTITASSTGYIATQTNLTVEDDTDAPISVVVDPATFAENAGPGAATGTVTIAANTETDLTINLTSTDVSEATVPASVTIVAGTNTTTFPVDAIDDIDMDGTRNVTIRATADGYTTGSIQIQVEDDGDVPPPPTLNPGDIAFVGFNADGNDNLAFVALSPIAETDTIIFTDNEWNGMDIGAGGAFIDTNEGFIIWTAPAGGVAAGTVVALNDLATTSRSASVGTVTASGSFNLGGTAETVYAFQGAMISPTGFLAVVATHTGDLTTGTGLGASHIVYLPDNADIAAFTGSRTNQTTYAGYLALLGDTATNWVTEDGSDDQSANATPPDVPFDSTSFTLAEGTSFAGWIGGFDVGTLTGLADDPDGDGLGNGAENILGSDPSAGNAGLTPVATTGGSFVFRHSRADAPATDLAPAYEWSTDLVNWYKSGEGTGEVTIGEPNVITDGSPNDLVEVTVTVNPSGVMPRLFLRLSVAQIF